MKKVNDRLRKMILKSKHGSVKRKILVSIYKELIYMYTKLKRKKALRKAEEIIERYEPNNNYSKRQKKKILKQMCYYVGVYRAIFSEYYMLDFRNMTDQELEEYVTNGDGKQYLRYLNTNTYKFTQNKFDTYKAFAKYYKREMILINGMEDFEEFEKYCQKHPVFVKKPHSAECGKGVELIDTNKKNLSKLFKQLVIENKSFIVEEKIEQDEVMASLHPSSVNTVRILPYVDKKGKVTIHKPFLKVGQNSSFVDNGGAGGILALIDAKTGKVLSDGMDELRNEFVYHPNTNVKFKGFQIPKWKELIDMMKEAALLKPEGRYLGFDVALSKNGWVIVECNSMTAFIGQQMPMKQGIKKEFEKLIDWESVENKEQYNYKPSQRKTLKKKKRCFLRRVLSFVKRKIENRIKKFSYKNKFFKKIYSNILYKRYYKKHYDNIMKQVNIYYSGHSKSKTKKCIKDMIYSKYVYGIIYAEYFMFGFAGKSHKERKEYISNSDRHMYLQYLNQNDFYHRFTDKYESYMLYKKYYKRDLVYIRNDKDYKIFEQFCIKHGKVVKKPVDSSLGKGIELIDTKNKNLKSLFKDILEVNNEFILEEPIKQSKEMEKLHPNSVNTIRVIPYLKNDGTVVIHYPFLKMGQKGTFVDNAGAGGIVASINPKSGKVLSDGMDESLNVYKKHPDTKIKIKGLQLPDWDDLISLATKLVKENPNARYVGWDFAHTPKGWIVVEGNGKTMFVCQQITFGKGIKDDLEELIDWKNVPNKEQYKRKKA